MVAYASVKSAQTRFLGVRLIILLLVCLFVLTIRFSPNSYAQENEIANSQDAEILAENLDKRVEELFDAGSYELAIEFANRSLAAKQKAFSNEHPKIAESYNDLANIYAMQEDFLSAEKYYIKALALREKVLNPNHLDIAKNLKEFAFLYYDQNDYSTVEKLLLRALKIRQNTLGSDHPDLAEDLNDLAVIYSQLNKYEDAEQLLVRSLNINEINMGSDHLTTGLNLYNLGRIYRSQNKYKKAETVFLRALEIEKKSGNSDNFPNIEDIQHEMAHIYEDQGFFSEAEPLFIDVLEIKEKSLGNAHAETLKALNDLGSFYTDKLDYTNAKPILLRALESSRESLGIVHHETADAMANLANFYLEQGAFTEAEPLYRQVISIRESLGGRNDPLVAEAFGNLASLYMSQEEFLKAEPLYNQALKVLETVHGELHNSTAITLHNMAFLQSRKGNIADAIELSLRSLKITESILPLDDPSIGTNLNNLGQFYVANKNYVEAEKVYLRAIRIYETKLGLEHSLTATGLNNLATLYRDQGRHSKSEEIYLRSLGIFQGILGPEHPSTAKGYGNLAGLYKLQRDFKQAQIHYKFGASIFERRAILAAGGDIRSTAAYDKELKDNNWYFYSHALTSAAVEREFPGEIPDAYEQAYSSTQYALRTSAGAALGQAAARFASGNDDLSGMVRARQELTSDWEEVNKKLLTSIGLGLDNRNEETEHRLRERLVTIDSEVAELDESLSSDFPEYFALTSPKPLSVRETQKLLYDNEALVMFLTGFDGTLVFAVTKDSIDWTPVIDMNTSNLEEAVRVLRQSLENPQNPFPRSQSYGIYKTLMSDIEGLISDKDHVFLVPSGALNSIPLSVLVTSEPFGDDSSPENLRKTSWWGTEQALTTLPSISSLKALRLLEKESQGQEPFAGFGNPVLDGPDGTDFSVQKASRGTGAYFRGRYADIDAVRSLSPLPQTEIELIALAKALRAKPKQSLWLADRATETNLKAADLSKKRVIAFATHGLMSGEMSGLSEPALVLTPPEEATNEDDGLLTASEAAQLNLNADWIILSACNTAAADQPGAEGLSGLARSFFYAGARTLLVSHWPVRDDAAARLTTTAINIQDEDPNLGKAEALRRTMILLMNDTLDPSLAHPSAWAPFVIVGEGGNANSPSRDNFNLNAYTDQTNVMPREIFRIICGGILILIIGTFILIIRRRKRRSEMLSH